MPYIEHPDITRVNRHGHLRTAVEERTLHKCDNCEVLLTPGDEIIEMYDHIFCDEDCLTEAFSQNPLKYGAEVKKLA